MSQRFWRQNAAILSHFENLSFFQQNFDFFQKNDKFSKWLKMAAFCLQNLWDIAFDRFLFGAQFENGKKKFPKFSTHRIWAFFWAKNRKNRKKKYLLTNKPGFDGLKTSERFFFRFQIEHRTKTYRMRCPRGSGSKMRPF